MQHKSHGLCFWCREAQGNEEKTEGQMNCSKRFPLLLESDTFFFSCILHFFYSTQLKFYNDNLEIYKNHKNRFFNIRTFLTQVTHCYLTKFLCSSGTKFESLLHTTMKEVKQCLYLENSTMYVGSLCLGC